MFDAGGAAAVDEAAALPLPALSPPLAPFPAGGAAGGAAAAVAPVAAIRASRSAAVVQVTLVPAELTNGSAAQLEKEGRISRGTEALAQNHVHGSATAGLEDELATHALCELVVHTGDVASVASRGRCQRLELVAVCQETSAATRSQTWKGLLLGDGILTVLESELGALARDEAGAGGGGESQGEGDENGVLHIWS